MKYLHFTVLVGIGLLLFAGFTRWQNLEEEPLIITDGQGYYAYLPAVLIYHDLQFSFVDSINEKYYPSEKRAGYVVPTPSGNVNKYFVGTAFVQAPFFVVACALSAAFGVAVDGYSWPFQLMVGVAAIFYLVMGMWLLNRTLLNMGFSKTPANFSVLLMLFGTNLLYYTLYEPSMSHVYSFFTVSAFIYFVHRAIVGENARAWILSSAALGLTILIRPTNGIIALAIPAIANGMFPTVNAMEVLFRKKTLLFLSILTGGSMVALQMLIYWLQTGSPLVWSYQEEGFNFASPELINTLFSYRKGLFVYSPVLLISIYGMTVGVLRGKARYAWLLLFLSVVLWIVSSWWMWFYGGSFGQRAFIEYLPFFAIGSAFAYRYGSGVIRPWLLYSLTVPLIAVQLVQTYQYTVNILPFDKLKKEQYWDLFLKTDDDLIWYYSPGAEEYTALEIARYAHTMESEIPDWYRQDQITDTVAKNGSGSAVMLPGVEYGLTLMKNARDLPLPVNLIKVAGWVKVDTIPTDLSIVLTMEDSTGAAYYWSARLVWPQLKKANEWEWFEAIFKCGPKRNDGDKYLTYPLRSDSSTVFFDDLEVSFIHAE